MKKTDNEEIAEFYGLHKNTIVNYKKGRFDFSTSKIDILDPKHIKKKNVYKALEDYYHKVKKK